MLSITIPAREYYDENLEEFVSLQKDTTIQLEHSLMSVAKWESKWKKPFMSNDKKTYAESIDYIKCMTVTQNVKPEVYRMLTRQNFEEINHYIDDPMTATTIKPQPGGPRTAGRNGELVTAEIIYYWMVSLGIPFECQKWHLKRLLTLIEVCSIKNAPQRKMSQKEIMQQNMALNAARKAKHHTRG